MEFLPHSWFDVSKANSRARLKTLKARARIGESRVPRILVTWLCMTMRDHASPTLEDPATRPIIVTLATLKVAQRLKIVWPSAPLGRMIRKSENQSTGIKEGFYLHELAPYILEESFPLSAMMYPEGDYIRTANVPTTYRKTSVVCCFSSPRWGAMAINLVVL